MKSIYNKLFIATILIGLSACTLDEVENPNAPTYGSFLDGASQADCQLLAVGLEAVMRNDLEFHYQTVSIIGREYYDLTGVDPRFTGELLKGPLDNNGFLTTRAYAAWYKIVQSANLVITAVENSAAGFDDATKNGYYGYANTLKAYALSMVANRQYDNGIRIDVSDPDNLGDFVSYSDALTEIMGILNDANTQLGAAGAEFDFPLSAGFSGFDTPDTFAEFNRALAARVAIYQGNKALALTLLGDSFFDLTGDQSVGVSHVFGLTGNDIANAQFYIPNQDRFMAHDSFVADAEAGDSRLSKVQLFDPDDDPDMGPITITFDDLSADYQAVVYSSNTDPIDIIRNEELILLYAEANIGTDNFEALDALDEIRNAAGLGNSTADPFDDDEVLDELLTQRRYSLFGEGHRWVDLRRYDRLDEIPLDRTGDNALSAFPTPVTENASL